ncbi:MAG: carbamoyltransferase HypF, partial [Cyclobacteriaceae bacterium]
GRDSELKNFVRELSENPPELARITKWKTNWIERSQFRGFEIVESRQSEEKSVLLTPDYAICPTCERELLDPENRRYRYPFITCTSCGPRYSIIEALPYDRERTAMDPFEMCSECFEEYNRVTDRRYYSQTNSCSNCGIHLFYHRDGEMFEEHYGKTLDRIKIDLLSGEILAVKGIGGYLLMCDATNAETVNLLRQRKGRPSKPLAMIYPDEQMLHQDVHVRQEELDAYRSVEAPIVLFERKENPASGIAVDAIAPALGKLGIMRPSAPLLSLIAHDFGKPLVATSGNLSGSPIIYDDKQAVRSLSWIADAVVSHDRRIYMPEDDSVVSFTPVKARRIVMRRSRGMAPNFFGPPLSSDHDQANLAMGASLKSTFALHHDGNTYISQYLGDQDSFDTQESYRQTLRHMSNVLEFRPDKVLTDLHPHYSSTVLGNRISQEEGIPIETIQHHEAHFAAVLGENDLLSSGDKILGVIWDGTGYGNDGNIWGGEFFKYENGLISRVAHLDYYNHLLGNKMPREPRLSALTLLHNTVEQGMLRPYFMASEWDFYQKLLRKEPKLFSSSAGRLFDAAACLLGLGDKISFEGEAAIALEALAGNARKKDRIAIDPDQAKSPAYHLLRMLRLIRQGYTKADAAWQFHSGMADVIQLVAKKYRYDKLAFSGGVFQNGVLTDIILERMGNDFKLYFHRELSPNDENISYGQLMYEMNIKENHPSSVMADSILN